MCRGCFFCQYDSSGVDVDGCTKADILEDLVAEFPDCQKLKKACEDFERIEENEEGCFEGLDQPKPKNLEEDRRQADEWWNARERAVKRFEADMRKLCEEVEV